MSEQLVLGLNHPPALTDADFFVAPCNALALRLVEAWPDWSAPAAIIHGPPGSGKTHLAQIWRIRSGAVILPARDFTAAMISEAGFGPIVLEDADTGPLDEAGVFHLLNLAREMGFSVLLTGRKAPGHWDIALPDLRSRIRSYPAASIAEPDDELLGAVVLKLFTDRQMQLSPDAAPYLLQRMERSLEAAQALVAEIDTASLSAQRRVTKAFIAAHLKARGGSAAAADETGEY
jgi:chromosomal replication initiation ATPase DnaA